MTHSKENDSLREKRYWKRTASQEANCVYPIFTTHTRSLREGNIFSRVCLFVCLGRGVQVTITHVTLRYHLGTPDPLTTWTCSNLSTCDHFPSSKPVQEHTYIGKRAVGLRLKSFLVYFWLISLDELGQLNWNQWLKTIKSFSVSSSLILVV